MFAFWKKRRDDKVADIQGLAERLIALIETRDALRAGLTFADGLAEGKQTGHFSMEKSIQKELEAVDPDLSTKFRKASRKQALNPQNILLYLLLLLPTLAGKFGFAQSWLRFTFYGFLETHLILSRSLITKGGIQGHLDILLELPERHHLKMDRVNLRLIHSDYSGLDYTQTGNSYVAAPVGVPFASYSQERVFIDATTASRFSYLALLIAFSGITALVLDLALPPLFGTVPRVFPAVGFGVLSVFFAVMGSLVRKRKDIRQMIRVTMTVLGTLVFLLAWGILTTYGSRPSRIIENSLQEIFTLAVGIVACRLALNRMERYKTVIFETL